ncbi:membrane translocase subunit TIM16 [Seminavis robusta]|uniref:Membrane translocase subunit TIM16 n=1 Tax=Seminavis robusta TaxID=568900 RepID=A0A9N8HNR9_9STRA|nr:membrane translocase subunit TIM16 [Seminavis robusta]|eukprot:Sro1247_g255850.1 membrane translocase subunit TIM16 (161) ;mRNA; r:4260-4907
MAVGPFARILAQLVVPVVAVLARALPAAYAQALQNARKAGGAAAADAAAKAPLFGKKAMSQQEALQILNMTEQKALTPEAVQKQFEKFMEANDVSKGGSFYLQSKFYRANELLQDYIQDQHTKTGTTGPVAPTQPDEEEDTQQQQSANDSSSSEQQQQQK